MRAAGTGFRQTRYGKVVKLPGLNSHTHGDAPTPAPTPVRPHMMTLLTVLTTAAMAAENVTDLGIALFNSSNGCAMRVIGTRSLAIRRACLKFAAAQRGAEYANDWCKWSQLEARRHLRLSQRRPLVMLHISHAGGHFMCSAAHRNCESTPDFVCMLRSVPSASATEVRVDDRLMHRQGTVPYPDAAGTSRAVRNCSVRLAEHLSGNFTFSAIERGFESGEYCPKQFQVRGGSACDSITLAGALSLRSTCYLSASPSRG